jgi:hypothetical protein
MLYFYFKFIIALHLNFYGPAFCFSDCESTDGMRPYHFPDA